MGDTFVVMGFVAEIDSRADDVDEKDLHDLARQRPRLHGMFAGHRRQNHVRVFG